MKSMKQARESVGLTQIDLSLMIGKSVQTLRNYEQGSHNIPKETRDIIVGFIGEFEDKRHS